MVRSVGGHGLWEVGDVSPEPVSAPPPTIQDQLDSASLEAKRTGHPQVVVIPSGFHITVTLRVPAGVTLRGA